MKRRNILMKIKSCFSTFPPRAQIDIQSSFNYRKKSKIQKKIEPTKKGEPKAFFPSFQSSQTPTLRWQNNVLATFNPFSHSFPIPEFGQHGERIIFPYCFFSFTVLWQESLPFIVVLCYASAVAVGFSRIKSLCARKK